MNIREANKASSVRFRKAKRGDIPAVVAMLADDLLGSGREATDAKDIELYLQAFDDMKAQGGNDYLLAVDAADNILGCAQLVLIPGLSRGGMKRAQIEGVRVAAEARGLGIGRRLLQEARAIAEDNGCGLIQLTSDRVRTEALRFYNSLGYEKSHWGLKLALKSDAQTIPGSKAETS